MSSINKQIIELNAEVPYEMGGQRLDQVAALLFAEHSRSRLSAWIKEGLLTVDGEVLRPRDIVHGGALLALNAEQEAQGEWIAQDIALNIVYEDEQILVIDKPAGLVVHPAAGHADGTLLNALLHHVPDIINVPRAGIVHRLDKDTSGVLVVGKNDFAVENLTQQFKARTVHRLYEAAVKAQGLPGHGTIQSYLARSPSDRKKYASLKGAGGKIIRENSPHITLGKWAVTHFTLLKKNLRGQARLELKLETGRTHQIRVHLTEMGWPVLGDPIYGKSAGLNSPRLCLHAKELGFRHPRSDQALHFFCPWPTDTLNYLSELGL